MPGGFLGIDQRACPECKAIIGKDVTSCPQCKVKFDAFGYVITAEKAAEAANVDGEVKNLYRFGKLLVARSGTKFPDRCIKTNAPTTKRLKRDLYWHHPAVYILIFVTGILIYAIIALIVRKKATVEIPLTEERLEKRKRDIMIAWGLFVFSLVMFFAAGVTNTGALALLGGVALLASPIYWLAVGQIVSPRKIENDYVHLAGVCPEFLNTLPEWRG